MPPKVSVIVPVYNPGADIDDCIRSLLGQSLPQDELELVFVDDGSTDGTPARLDELAARHAHVRVEHIPNSGWPGRPRNVGLELARGDYVHFVDNDDWVAPDALERLHAMAVSDDADIVIGKVVGHGKVVSRTMFRRNLHGVSFDSPSLLHLLAPHKLFRRGFIEKHGLRFAEGRRRLEDHLFVVEAYFLAKRISLLADRPCYHWVGRDATANASLQRFEPEAYFDNVREVLDLVERRTEAGPSRERLREHWYRGKMLGRVGGGGWLNRDPDYRRALYEAVRRLALERFADDVHERLPFNLRVRSRLLRQGSFEGLEALAGVERSIRARIRLRAVEAQGADLVVRLESRLGDDGGGLRFERRGERLLWQPPGSLRSVLPEEHLDATDDVAGSAVQVFLHGLRDGSEYVLDARTEVRLDAGREAGGVRPRLVTTAPIAPATAAAGSPLPLGRWEIRAAVNVAGFSHVRKVRRHGAPLVLAHHAPGHIVVAALPPPPAAVVRRLRRRLAGRLEKAIRWTRGAAGAAFRG